MDRERLFAISPVQLATVLADRSVTEAEALSNRLLGGLELAMGTVELAGAWRKAQACQRRHRLKTYSRLKSISAPGYGLNDWKLSAGRIQRAVKKHL